MRVIIVHQNERTLNASRRSAEEQVGKENVYLISLSPFAASLRRAFAMAVNRKWEWMTLMGGDQILKNGAIETLEREIEKADSNVFRISGYGDDGLLMRTRMMAPSAYRVRLLSEALKINTERKIRPESFVLYLMKKRGYPFIIINDILATHDKGQYYRDIYRKGLFTASKSMKYVIDHDVIKDLENSKSADLRLFLLGITDFVNNIERTSQEALDFLNLKEKK